MKDLSNGKADVTISDQLTAMRYLDNNPGAIEQKRGKMNSLVSMELSTFLTKTDDVIWAQTIDGILSDLLDFGVIDRIMADNHMVAGRHYYPIAPRYQK